MGPSRVSGLSELCHRCVSFPFCRLSPFTGVPRRFA
ncbi:hypothetical protein NPIL_113311, partial [Nephila pilipes]